MATAGPNCRPRRSGSCCTPRRRETYRLLRHYGDFSLIGGDWRDALTSLVPVGEEDWLPVLARAGLANGAPFDRRTGDQRWREQVMPRRFTQEEAGALIEGRMAEIAALEYRDPQIARRARETMTRLARRLAARKGKLVIVVMPARDELRQAMARSAPSWKEGFDGLLAAARTSGATIIDAGRLADGRLQPADFADPVHLNRQGAETLAEILRAQNAF